MTTRLRQRLAANAASGRRSLVIYITQGDPSPEATIDIALAVDRAGADVLELGVPFSDPNADGVVIQHAMQRALAGGRGAGLDGSLAAVSTLRARGCELPIVLFGYYNPIFVHGTERFARDARDAGADAVLTVDVPLDELAELAVPLRAAGVDVVPLIAPTSGDDRIELVREFDPPFVYYISMTGITGASFRPAAEMASRVARIRAAASAPVAVGFGIKTGADARAVAAYADGVVVGSAVVTAIEQAAPGGAPAAVEHLVRELRGALDVA